MKLHLACITIALAWAGYVLGAPVAHSAINASLPAPARWLDWEPFFGIASVSVDHSFVWFAWRIVSYGWNIRYPLQLQFQWHSGVQCAG